MSELKPTTEESIRHFEAQQKRYVREHGGKPCPHYANAIEALHRAQPENEPLVRCGNCKRYNRIGCADGFGWCERMNGGASDDFYCSYGEKMEATP